MQLLSLRRRGGGYGQISTTVTPLPISPMKNLIVLFKFIIEIVKINTTKRQALRNYIPFLRLTSEPFKKLHKCDRVLKTRPCNAMSNGIGKDMHFRCHIQNAHNVNMSMGQKMLYRISKAPFLVLEPKALLLNVQLRKVHCSYNTDS